MLNLNEKRQEFRQSIRKEKIQKYINQKRGIYQSDAKNTIQKLKEVQKNIYLEFQQQNFLKIAREFDHLIDIFDSEVYNEFIQDTKFLDLCAQLLTSQDITIIYKMTTLLMYVSYQQKSYESFFTQYKIIQQLIYIYENIQHNSTIQNVSIQIQCLIIFSNVCLEITEFSQIIQKQNLVPKVLKSVESGQKQIIYYSIYFFTQISSLTLDYKHKQIIKQVFIHTISQVEESDILELCFQGLEKLINGLKEVQEIHQCQITQKILINIDISYCLVFKLIQQGDEITLQTLLTNDLLNKLNYLLLKQDQKIQELTCEAISDMFAENIKFESFLFKTQFFQTYFSLLSGCFYVQRSIVEGLYNLVFNGKEIKLGSDEICYYFMHSDIHQYYLSLLNHQNIKLSKKLFELIKFFISKDNRYRGVLQSINFFVYLEQTIHENSYLEWFDQL